MIGIKGTLKETETIQAEVRTFLESIGLKLSDTKTKITNINTDEALFLGTLVKRAREYSYSRPSHNNMLRRNSKKLRLEAPISRILKKLREADFMNGEKARPKLV